LEPVHIFNDGRVTVLFKLQRVAYFSFASLFAFKNRLRDRASQSWLSFCRDKVPDLDLYER
jgi:hypothetical protein